MKKYTIELTEEQEQFFIETWDNNQSLSAIVILRDKLGFGSDALYSIAKRLREEGKLRDKTHVRYSEKEVLAFKCDYENGRSFGSLR